NTLRPPIRSAQMPSRSRPTDPDRIGIATSSPNSASDRPSRSFKSRPTIEKRVQTAKQMVKAKVVAHSAVPAPDSACPRAGPAMSLPFGFRYSNAARQLGFRTAPNQYVAGTGVARMGADAVGHELRGTRNLSDALPRIDPPLRVAPYWKLVEPCRNSLAPKKALPLIVINKRPGSAQFLTL